MRLRCKTALNPACLISLFLLLWGGGFEQNIFKMSYCLRRQRLLDECIIHWRFRINFVMRLYMCILRRGFWWPLILWLMAYSSWNNCGKHIIKHTITYFYNIINGILTIPMICTKFIISLEWTVLMDGISKICLLQTR
jgi:hypothetical protein